MGYFYHVQVKTVAKFFLNAFTQMDRKLGVAFSLKYDKYSKMQSGFQNALVNAQWTHGIYTPTPYLNH